MEETRTSLILDCKITGKKLESVERECASGEVCATLALAQRIRIDCQQGWGQESNR